MLLFIVLSGKAVAQTKPSENLYSVEKICADSLVVNDGKLSQRMSVSDALKINEAYPLQKQVERNAVIFTEMRKK